MGTKLRCNPFELLAFEAEVAEHPGCLTSQAALRDFLQDNGYTFMGARQHVAKLVRIATAQKQANRVAEVFKDDPVLEREVVRSLMMRSGVPTQPWPTLRIVLTQLVPAFVSGQARWVDSLGLEAPWVVPASPECHGYRLEAAWARWEISPVHALAIIEEITGDRHDV